MSKRREKALEQMSDFAKAQAKPEQLTTAHGQPVGNKTNLLTVGPRGPGLLQDVVFMDEMAHFDRERIPERVVHAKGAGAFGYFEVTHDITRFTRAKIFERIGKQTPMAARFSTVSGEKGSADTARDPRGFALKFYTEEGNWDLVGNNTPIFFIRDPLLFPTFIHLLKRNPVTNLKDPDLFWDFMGLRPETCHQLTLQYTDRGTPDGYRFMNGYSSHTYKLVNAKGDPVYCKFHTKTNQGIKCLTASDAKALEGSDPDYATRDLYNAIADGNCPSWTMYIQVMTFKEAETCSFHPFDVTKVWPQGEYPLIPFGKFTLNRNPKNYFAEIEQIAMSPSHFVPGIESSPDKMLQGRLFAYGDTHRHRLGTNYLQLPVNCPYNTRVKNYQRDGPQTFTFSEEGAPNYYPNSFSGPDVSQKYLEPNIKTSGDIGRYDNGDDDNFSQAGVFWRNVLTPDARTRLVENIAGHLQETQEFIQKRVVNNLSQCDPEYGRRIQELLDKYNADKEVPANL